MTQSPTNWPDPERPGYPSWPEHYGKHVLFSKETGDDVIADWNKSDAEWLLPNGSLKAKNAAKYYIYSHCDSVELTPAQINEMLAGEREKCAQEAIHIGESWEGTELSPCNTARHIAQAIRNLGDAP